MRVRERSRTCRFRSRRCGILATVSTLDPSPPLPCPPDICLLACRTMLTLHRGDSALGVEADAAAGAGD